jgi:rhodanese-related sulfurtransferase
VVGGAPVGADVALDTNYQVMLGAMQAYNTIDAETLMAEMAEDAPPFLLDVRTTEEVEANGHIEGATHIPLAELAQHIDLLPSFDTPIVTYCGSGWRATIAMTALHGMGWTDVRALKVAFEDWVAAGNPVVEGLPENVALNAAEVDAALLEGMDAMLAIYGAKPYGVIEAEGLNTALVENPALIVIDVRTPEEVAEKGVIDTGEAEFIFLPLEELVATKDLWPADKSAEIAVYCGSGHRSTMALTILGSYGYTKLSSLKGGFAEWAEAGYPVTEYALADTLTSDTAVIDANLQTMLDTMQAYNTVSAEDLMTEMVEDAPPFLLDVRTAEEVEASGHIEGATHIPLNELAQHLNLLPSFDTPIVTYCGTGWRATIAMTSLHALGWTDVRALKTTFEEWVAAGNPVVEGLPENIVLDAASPDPVAVSTVNAALTAYGVKPFGVIEADGLNTALVENADLIVIDARTPAEIEEKGVIDTGAEPPLFIPLEEIIAQMDQWPADKAALIVEYCGSGHRSTMAMTILWLHGYSNVSSLKGGFGAWAEAGYPVTEYVAE